MKNKSNIGLVSLQPKFIKRTDIENPDPNLEVLDYNQLVEYLTGDKYLPIIEQMNAIRAKEGKSEAYSKVKRKLPGLAFAGTFEGNYREQKRIKTTSGLLLADLDGVSEDRLEEIYNVLKGSPYVFFCGYSSSGEGLHALIKIPDYAILGDATPQLTNKRFKHAFNKISKEFKASLDVKLDPMVAGVHALMFAGNPKLPKHINHEVKTYPIPLYVPQEKKSKSTGPRSKDAKGVKEEITKMMENGLLLKNPEGERENFTYSMDLVGAVNGVGRHAWILSCFAILVNKYDISEDEFLEIVLPIADTDVSRALPAKTEEEITKAVSYVFRTYNEAESDKDEVLNMDNYGE